MEYKELTLESLTEEISKLFYDKAGKSGFTKPMGQIGDSGVYRISDNCLGGKGAWDAFQEALLEEGKRYIDNIKKLTYTDVYQFKDSYAYVVSLKANNLPTTRKELIKLRKEATLFEVDGQIMVLKGIEMYTVENIGDKVSLWLKPIKDEISN